MRIFFSISTCTVFYPQRGSSDVDADCRHCSTPFYVRALSIHGVCDLQGPWNQSCVNTKGQQVWAESKVVREFSAAWVGAAGGGGCQVLPTLFKDQLCRLPTVRSQRTLASIFF